MKQYLWIGAKVVAVMLAFAWVNNTFERTLTLERKLAWVLDDLAATRKALHDAQYEAENALSEAEDASSKVDDLEERLPRFVRERM